MTQIEQVSESSKVMSNAKNALAPQVLAKAKEAVSLSKRPGVHRSHVLLSLAARGSIATISWRFRLVLENTMVLSSAQAALAKASCAIAS